MELWTEYIELWTPELRGPALVCLSALDKKIALYCVNLAVLVFLMGQNPKCPKYN